MAPVPAGEFQMGSDAAGAKADEQPQHKVRVDAFWMQTHEVTWDSYLMFMFADQAKERATPDALVDAQSRPTGPHLEMSFGRGNDGFPAISMTQHAANKYAQWLSAKTGEYYRLPTEAEWEYACRAGTPTGIGPGPLDDYAWFKKNSRAAGVFRRHVPQDRHEEAERLGPLRHARERHGVDAGSVRAVHGRAGGEPLGQVHDVVSRMPPAAARGTTTKRSCDARRVWPPMPSWKKQDPQLPKSIWYMTDAQWLGFRLVRPATLPSAEEMYRAWNNGVELDPY